MKKHSLLLVLSALFMVGCDNVNSSSSSVPQITYHAITLPTSVTGAHVYSSATSASEGTTVTVTVVLTDSTTHQLDAVKMNGTVLTGTVDTNNDKTFNYNFLMPNEAVAITVETSEIVIPKKHAITLPTSVTGAHVYSSVASASEGTTVTVTVILTDSTTHQLDAVKMNGTVLTGTVDPNNDKTFNYNFLMPNEAVAITVETSEIVIPKKDHVIKVKTNDLTEVLNLPTEANVGDAITFDVRCVSGYELNAVTAKTDTAEIKLSGDAVQGFTFAMPDADVTIETEALGAYFEISVDNDETVITANDTRMTALTFTKGFYNTDLNYANTSTRYLRAGQKAYILGSRNNYAHATHYYVNGVEALAVDLSETLQNNNFLFEFTMPNKNAIVNVDAEVTSIHLKLETSEHVSGTMYKNKDETKTPITQETLVYPGETINVTFSSTDETLYPTNSIMGEYKSYSGQNTIGLVDNDYLPLTKLVDLSTYSRPFKWNNSDKEAIQFTIPTSYYESNSTMTIKLGEADYTKFQGQAFLGTWSGIELYSPYGFSSGTAWSTSNTVITGDGSLTSSTSYLKGTIESVKGNHLIINDSSNKQKNFVYDGSVALMEYQPDKKGTDFYMLVNNFTGSSLVKDIYKDDASKTAVIRFLNSDSTVVFGTALVKYDETLTEPTEYFIPNVTIELLGGTTKISEGNFTVAKNNETIYSKTKTAE